MTIQGRQRLGRASPSANALVRRQEAMSKSFEKGPVQADHQDLARRAQSRQLSRETPSSGNQRPPPDSYNLRELQRIGDSQRHLQSARDPRFSRTQSSRELTRGSSYRSPQEHQTLERQMSLQDSRRPTRTQSLSPPNGYYTPHVAPPLMHSNEPAPKTKVGGLKKLFGGGRKKQVEQIPALDHVQIRLATANAAFAAVDGR
jgi:hypothetical protein